MNVPDKTAEDFRAALHTRFSEAQGRGAPHVEIRAGDLHGSIGGYPGTDHRMPVCCDVMYQEMHTGDRIIESPSSRYGASLTIRYILPRTTRDQEKQKATT
jgi:5-methylcytosine-specific restriction protein A